MKWKIIDHLPDVIALFTFLYLLILGTLRTLL